MKSLQHDAPLLGARERLSFLLASAAVLVSLVLACRMPGNSRWLAVLNDAAHAPVFGALSLVAFSALGLGQAQLPERSRYAIAFLSTIALGGLVELLQIPIGRGASWHDVQTDALGASCALAILVWRRSGNTATRVPLARKRTALAVAAMSLVGIFAPIAEAGYAYWRRIHHYPELASFAGHIDLYFLYPQAAEVTRAQLPPTWRRRNDPKSLRLRVLPGSYPGITYFEPAPDWTGLSSLKLDVTNPAQRALTLTMAVYDKEHDWTHENRFNRSFELPPRSRSVLQVPLRDIEAAPIDRTLDLGRIAGLKLFASETEVQPGQVFYVTRLWLE